MFPKAFIFSDKRLAINYESTAFNFLFEESTELITSKSLPKDYYFSLKISQFYSKKIFQNLLVLTNTNKLDVLKLKLIYPSAEILYVKDQEDYIFLEKISSMLISLEELLNSIDYAERRLNSLINYVLPSTLVVDKSITHRDQLMFKQINSENLGINLYTRALINEKFIESML